MATTIKMPQLGESVTEGTIERWLVKEGDRVEQYDPLFEVVTDKVNAEVPAEIAGVVTKIIVPDGETVKVGTPLAEIDAEGNGAAAAAPESAAQADAQPQTAQPEVAQPPAAETEPVAEAAAQPLAAEQAPAEAQPAAEQAPVEAQPAAQPAAEPVAVAQAPTPAPSAPASSSTDGAETISADAADGSMRMTPAVRRLVRENEVEIAQIRGSGAAGRVTREDVLAYVAKRDAAPAAAPSSAPQAAVAAPSAPAAEAPALSAPIAPPAQAAPPPAATAQAAPPPPAAPPPSSTPSVTPAPASPPTFTPSPVPAPTAGDVEMPMSQMRKGIAAKMTRVKQTVPHAYTVVEVDMRNPVRWREANQAAYKAREGIGISYVAVVIKAVTETLRQHPTLNSQFADDRVILKQEMNIGIAVAVDNGLLVPVIHNADQLSISGVNRKVQDLAARARINKLRLDEIQGGTFTVNNTGWFGSVTSMPIINAPEVAILSMEAIVKRPVVREIDGEEAIVVRPIMNMTCSFDHRVLDGAQVGYFLADVRRRLEEWDPNTPLG
jgi:2-oxoisovalerate dehydrogenase E2 component (dihydrolipoyl transacylase)